jgi:ribosomal protein S18 acetylase RimI-like enzyme
MNLLPNRVAVKAHTDFSLPKLAEDFARIHVLAYSDRKQKLSIKDDLRKASLNEMQKYQLESWPKIFKNFLSASQGEKLPRIYTATYDGQVAGVAFFQDNHFYLKDSESALMTSLCVAPEFHRKGIARSILNVAEQEIKSFGYRELALEVECDNTPAISAYNHMRWHQSDRPNGEKGCYHYYTKDI